MYDFLQPFQLFQRIHDIIHPSGHLLPDRRDILCSQQLLKLLILANEGIHVLTEQIN